MEIHLSKDARAVANAASKDDSRPVLTSINFEKGEIIAADGYVLARRKVKGIPAKGKSFMLPAAQILSAKDIGKTLDYAMLQIGNGNSKAGTLTGADGIKSTITKQDGTFPNYEALMPKKDAKPQAEIKLAVDVLKTMIRIAGNSNKIKLTIYGPSEVLAFRCSGFNEEAGDTYGIAMPMVH